MDFSHYEDDIRVQLEIVTATHRTDSKRCRIICETLLSKGDELNDNTLIGFAYCYLALSYFVDNEYQLFVSNLLQGLKYQLQPPIPFLLTKSYNLLGINESYTGDISMAMDHYLHSLQYAEEAGLPYAAGAAYYNIGMIYRDLNDIDAAISSLKKGLANLKISPSSENRQRNINLTYSSLATCYLELGDTTSALHYFEQRDKQLEDIQDDAHIAALSFEIKYYHILEDHIRRDKAIDTILTIVENASSLTVVFDELFLLCEFLYKVGYLDQLWRLLCSIDSPNTQTGVTEMILKFITYKAYYYQGKGLHEKYLETCAEHFAMAKRQEKENQVRLKNSIKLREDLEKIKIEQRQMQTENKMLLDKSKRDFLTSLPNREWLNDYADTAFNKALQNRTPLAIEILDIDNFKQYNDILGHMAGDRYLQALSGLLHGLMESGHFCARYGGDEFVIIYENLSNTDILELSERLRQDVMDLSIADQSDVSNLSITISQGICSSVPMSWERTWDYFHAADQALYHVKNTGRNAIRLAPNLFELCKNPKEVATS